MVASKSAQRRFCLNLYLALLFQTDSQSRLLEYAFSEAAWDFKCQNLIPANVCDDVQKRPIG
jgi:hypothetical protein